MSRLAPGVLVLLMLCAAGCPSEPTIGDDDDSVDVGSAPLIEHTPVTDGQPARNPVLVEASVSDPDGVAAVSLHYRLEGAPSWNFTYMVEGEPGRFSAEIPENTVQEPGVEYYLRATDEGEPRGEGFHPDEAPDSFHAFAVTRPLRTLPFTEGFESGDYVSVGWRQFVEGFQDYNWQVRDVDPWSGSYAAWHGEAISGITLARQDWLVSPPLDLSGAGELTVSWFERGSFQASIGRHALYATSGSVDPADGDWELVAELPAAPDAWSRVEPIDLSAWSGQAPVSLAWYYEGEWADRWQMDDIYVGPPLADLSLDEIAAVPADFGPGDTVELSLTVSNLSDVPLPAATVSLETADPLLVPGAPEAFDGVGADASATIGPLSLTVDPAHVDNTFLDLTLLLEVDGYPYRLPFTLLMGSPSSFEVDWLATAGGPLTLSLGYGDPEVPSFVTTETFSETAGSWVVDVTAHAPALPPRAGGGRWFLTIENESAGEATVVDWRLRYEDALSSAEAAPEAVDPGGAETLLLPELPALQVTAVVTDPLDVAPGASGVSIEVEVSNEGPATAGPLRVTLASDDPGALALTGVDVPVGTGPLEAGESAVSEPGLGLDVAPDHIDNRPLELTLEATDGVDSFSLPFAVDVPSAHPIVAEVLLLDTPAEGLANNGDGLLDPGEQVEVWLTVLNEGPIDTTGPVTIEAVDSGTGTAAGSLLSGSATLGSTALAGGESRVADGPLLVEVTSGCTGDTLVLDVTFSDGVLSWTEPLALEVSPLPWQPLRFADDAIADADGYQFDIQRAWYKSDDKVLWLKFDAVAPFDPATVFFIVYVYATPNWWGLEFAYEEWTLEQGVFGTDVIDPEFPIIGGVEDTSVVVRVGLDDLMVVGRSVSVGGAAGFCGSDTYYCDLYPEGFFSFDLATGTINTNTGALSTISW